MTTAISRDNLGFHSLTPIQELKRSVMAYFLFQGSFYESGESITARIHRLVAQCKPYEVEELAREAKFKMNIRKAPMLLAVCLVKYHPSYPAARLIRDLMERASDITDFLVIYTEGRKGRKRLQKLDHQVRKGLSWAFRNFDAYQLDKYKNGSAYTDKVGRFTLWNAMRMIHPKPTDEAQAALWKQLKEDTLPSAGTWEQLLSAGQDKKSVWEYLLVERKLGYTALLKNLRNMEQVGVSKELVDLQIRAGASRSRELPFRFLAAARHAPRHADALTAAMVESLRVQPKLEGRTLLLVDVSGSMQHKLSAESELQRSDAAAGLALLVTAVARECKVFTFSHDLVFIDQELTAANVKQVLYDSQHNGGTAIAFALNALFQYSKDWKPDRIIVITDEQDTSGGPIPACPMAGYIMNVSVEKHGIGYDTWTHIHGFSEQCVRYLTEMENQRKLGEL